MPKLLLALALVLTGCSTSVGVPAGVTVPERQVSGHAGSSTNLFVSDHQNIYEYTRKGHLVRTIPLSVQGIDVGSLAFDASGYLYAISGYFDVSVFAPGSRRLVRTITDGIYEPTALTVDRSGNLYVANEENGANGVVSVYPPGSGTPSLTITQGLYDPESLALDSSGNLYVGNGSYADSVTVYSPSGTLLRTIADGIQDPTSMAIDARNELFVANTNSGAGRSVTIYSPGKNKLVQVITDGVDSPQSVAVDSTDQLYVANNANNTVTVYAAKTRKLLRTISKQVRYPWVLALDAADSLYVANLLPTAAIGVYPPGRGSPRRTIQSNGQWTVLALAFGPP